jgi:hypothetical protein
MIDFHRAKMRGHRRNIARYCRLLATELTDLERHVARRLSELVDEIGTIGEQPTTGNKVTMRIRWQRTLIAGGSAASRGGYRTAARSAGAALAVRPHS